MAVNIQLRRGTAAEWTAANPTLAVGEIGIETDTDKFKIGNGSDNWATRPYGGIQGPQGIPGVDGQDGVAAATAPLTYDAETFTIGLNQSGISITASQISDITASATELNYVDGVTSAIQTQLNSKAPASQTVSAKTGAYTLVATDNQAIITCNGTFTITAPSATFSAGQRVDFVNIGTGTITFAGSGVTINAKDGALTLTAQYAAATLVFTSDTQAYLIGSLG